MEMIDPDELRREAGEKTEAEHEEGLRGSRLAPHRLASPIFAQTFPKIFDTYVECRVDGLPRDLAAMEALQMIRLQIDLSNVDQLALAMESNAYVKLRMRKVAASKDIKKDLWPIHRSVVTLLQMIEDSSVRDTTRLNAVAQLNAMCGYVTLDEGLSRRVNQTLRDFERLDAGFSMGEGERRTLN